jgi:hypothetical protein
MPGRRQDDASNTKRCTIKIKHLPCRNSRVDPMWQNPNRIPAAQGPIVAVSPVRRRVV